MNFEIRTTCNVATTKTYLFFYNPNGAPCFFIGSSTLFWWGVGPLEVSSPPTLAGFLIHLHFLSAICGICIHPIGHYVPKYWVDSSFFLNSSPSWPDTSQTLRSTFSFFFESFNHDSPYSFCEVWWYIDISNVYRVHLDGSSWIFPKGTWRFFFSVFDSPNGWTMMGGLVANIWNKSSFKSHPVQVWCKVSWCKKCYCWWTKSCTTWDG